MKKAYEQVAEFHRVFDSVEQKTIAALPVETAEYRAGFKLEEILELLYAASEGDHHRFDQSVTYLQKVLETESNKLKEKQSPVDTLTDEVDALIDLLYFTYGSFVMMGIHPEPIFDIVHQANMGKVFPDGEAHYHPETGKVLKPKNWEKDFAPESKIKAEIKGQMEKQKQ